MKTSRLFFSAALLAAFVSTAHAKIERLVEKTFTVSAAGTLHVETHGGNIKVAPSNDSAVKITVRQRIRADTDAEADEILKKLTLTLEQSGNDVTASARYESQPSGFHFGNWPPVQVDFAVSVPASFATDLKTSGGIVQVGDLNGEVHARTSGGNIELGKIGGAVDASTSGGNVTLAEGRADVKLHTSGGHIGVNRAVGATELKTSGGNITIDSVENSLHASTSGGHVRAGIVGSLKGDCDLHTSGGNVTVTIDQGTPCHLDASTSGGNVSADGVTIAIEKGGSGKSRLAGDINGGGPLLKLRSSGGSIGVKVR